MFCVLIFNFLKEVVVQALIKFTYRFIRLYYSPGDVFSIHIQINLRKMLACCSQRGGIKTDAGPKKNCKSWKTISWPFELLLCTIKEYD